METQAMQDKVAVEECLALVEMLLALPLEQPVTSVGAPVVVVLRKYGAAGLGGEEPSLEEEAVADTHSAVAA